MKRRGFTLIELSVAMCIILILYSMSSIGIKSYNKYIKQIKYSESIFEIEDFLGRAKGRAINANKPEKISIEKQGDSYSIRLVEEGKTVEILYLGKTWRLINSNINSIDINTYGFIKPCTINMINDKDKYRITIRPGGDLVSDYKGES